MLNKRPLRVYADTTVFGGIADSEFERESRAFFREVRAGRFILVTSSLVRREISRAPEIVQSLFAEFIVQTEPIAITDEATRLRQAYVDAGIVRRKSLDDAMHVALASVNTCNIIVSWNFRDIVNFRKIPLYNTINVLNGYGNIAIHSPMEMITDEA